MNIRLLLLPVVLLAVAPAAEAATIKVHNVLSVAVKIPKSNGTTQEIPPDPNQSTEAPGVVVDGLGTTFDLQAMDGPKDAQGNPTIGTTCKAFTVDDNARYSIKYENGIIARRTGDFVEKCELPTTKVKLGDSFNANDNVIIQIPGQPDITMTKANGEKNIDTRQFTAKFGNQATTISIDPWPSLYTIDKCADGTINQKCPSIRVSFLNFYGSHQNDKVILQIPDQPDITMTPTNEEKTIPVLKNFTSFTVKVGNKSVTKENAKPGYSYIVRNNNSGAPTIELSHSR